MTQQAEYVGRGQGTYASWPAGLARQLGRAAAALAIALQLLLPPLAMQASAAAPQADAEAAMVAQASAVWGAGAICEMEQPVPDGAPHHTPAVHHACPVCWASHQPSSLPPPNLPPLPPAPLFLWVTAPLPAPSLFRPCLLAPAQPRAPPFV